VGQRPALSKLWILHKQGRSPGSSPLRVMERSPAAECDRPIRGRNLELQRTFSRNLFISRWHCQMSKNDAVGLLFVFLLFITEPILLGICARKIYHRSGAFWGLLTFGLNIGILVFFDTHLRSSSLLDAAAQVGIVMGLSSISMFATFELLRKGPHTRTAETFSINLRRGLFRIWVSVSGPWLILCAFEFSQNCKRYAGCDFFSNGDHFPSYFDIGKWLIGPPMLAFGAGLAACWVIDGFRRSPPTEDGGQFGTSERKPAIGEADESLAGD
jgi:hypothetical protein